MRCPGVMVLVERVSSVPGFFSRTWEATVRTSSGLSVWAGVLIVVVGLIADLAIARIDARIRASGRAPR